MAITKWQCNAPAINSCTRGLLRGFLPESVSRLKVKQSFGVLRALGGLLAIALLVCELLAGNSPFHQALHSGKAASNSCLLCLFAKGQIDSPRSVPLVTAPVRSSFDSSPRMETVAVVDFRYLASPSRAPPASTSDLPVAG